jgi:catechol 2,3-dioxygenase-like lactoylglutathione lyase family enzyme
MYTHVMVGTADPKAAKQFYDATMQALGKPASPMPEDSPRHFYGSPDGVGGGFGVGLPANGEAATSANGGTIGFAAKDKAMVDAWHAAGLANGGSCDGPPGHRSQAPGNAYGAYLRDPDGNKICAFCKG